jgi:hypothetical protein
MTLDDMIRDLTALRDGPDNLTDSGTATVVIQDSANVIAYDVESIRLTDDGVPVIDLMEVDP